MSREKIKTIKFLHFSYFVQTQYKFTLESDFYNGVNIQNIQSLVYFFQFSLTNSLHILHTHIYTHKRLYVYTTARHILSLAVINCGNFSSVIKGFKHKDCVCIKNYLIGVPYRVGTCVIPTCKKNRRLDESSCSTGCLMALKECKYLPCKT